MIPTFPEFKEIEISDREDVYNLTQKFPLYSDFNFTSMWSWDTKKEMRLSVLNGNLVVKFTDYLNCLPFYSFIGENNVNDTIKQLLDLSQKEGLEPELKLVPEVSVNGADTTKFVVEESRDHFDYIIDNHVLTGLKGRSLHSHANFKKRFITEHGESLQTKILNLDSPEIRNQIETLNKLWTKNKVDQSKEIFPDLEEKANSRFFDLDKTNQTFVTLGILKYSQLIGFTIDEVVKKDFSIRHFMKGDVTFKGIYSYLVSESSRILSAEYGVVHTNIEQDLGLQNLRQSKKSFDPILFLKKYNIKLYQ